jgi:hypothetical protein
MRYLSARRSGLTMMSSAVFAPMGIGEARLHDDAERAGEYAHIDTSEMPHPNLEQPTEAAAVDKAIQRESVNGDGTGGSYDSPMDGPASPSTAPEKMNMARRRTPKVEQVQQVIAPDFDLAVKIYHNDIKSAQSKVGEFSQEMSTAYKEIKKRANIQPQAAKLAFKLDAMEESKRDDYLRSLKGLLLRLKIFMPNDLVDVAEGKGATAEDVIPVGEPKAPQLATVPAMH